MTATTDIFLSYYKIIAGFTPNTVRKKTKRRDTFLFQTRLPVPASLDDDECLPCSLIPLASIPRSLPVARNDPLFFDASGFERLGKLIKQLPGNLFET
jgi:hypothetical protein